MKLFLESFGAKHSQPFVQKVNYIKGGSKKASPPLHPAILSKNISCKRWEDSANEFHREKELRLVFQDALRYFPRDHDSYKSGYRDILFVAKALEVVWPCPKAGEAQFLEVLSLLNTLPAYKHVVLARLIERVSGELFVGKIGCFRENDSKFVSFEFSDDPMLFSSAWDLLIKFSKNRDLSLFGLSHVVGT